MREPQRLATEISENVVQGVPVFEDYDGPGEDRVLFAKILGEPKFTRALHSALGDRQGS
jgi:hypothetical protein